MALSFSSLSYPVRAVNHSHMHRSDNKHSLRSTSSSLSSSSSSSVQLSSFTASTNETDENSSESHNSNYTLLSSPTTTTTTTTAVTQENTVGIIGGVSVFSTLIFLEKLVWWSSRHEGDKQNQGVPFIVCSDPLLKPSNIATTSCYESSSSSSSSSSYNSSYDDSKKGVFSGVDLSLVIESLKRKRVYLEEGGAQCIVMPCHVCYGWYKEIAQGCKLPFLHVGECVAMELKEARFKPLEAGCGVKIGVLATDAILMAGFYQEKLENEGFEVVLPDKATKEHIINAAIKSLKQKDKEGARNLLRIAIQVLLVRAASCVILACDELQGLLPHDDPLAKKCVDPMDALARSAVRWATSVKVHRKVT